MTDQDEALKRAVADLQRAAARAIASIEAFRKAWRESVRKHPR